MMIQNCKYWRKQER